MADRHVSRSQVLLDLLARVSFVPHVSLVLDHFVASDGLRGAHRLHAGQNHSARGARRLRERADRQDTSGVSHKQPCGDRSVFEKVEKVQLPLQMRNDDAAPPHTQTYWILLLGRVPEERLTFEVLDDDGLCPRLPPCLLFWVSSFELAVSACMWTTTNLKSTEVVKIFIRTNVWMLLFHFHKQGGNAQFINLQCKCAWLS